MRKISSNNSYERLQNQGLSTMAPQQTQRGGASVNARQTLQHFFPKFSGNKDSFVKEFFKSVEHEPTFIAESVRLNLLIDKLPELLPALSPDAQSDLHIKLIQKIEDLLKPTKRDFMFYAKKDPIYQITQDMNVFEPTAPISINGTVMPHLNFRSQTTKNSINNKVLTHNTKVDHKLKNSAEHQKATFKLLSNYIKSGANCANTSTQLKNDAQHHNVVRVSYLIEGKEACMSEHGAKGHDILEPYQNELRGRVHTGALQGNGFPPAVRVALIPDLLVGAIQMENQKHKMSSSKIVGHIGKGLLGVAGGPITLLIAGALLLEEDRPNPLNMQRIHDKWRSQLTEGKNRNGYEKIALRQLKQIDGITEEKIKVDALTRMYNGLGKHLESKEYRIAPPSKHVEELLNIVTNIQVADTDYDSIRDSLTTFVNNHKGLLVLRQKLNAAKIDAARDVEKIENRR
ncbi:MAG: hypothetical protein ACXU8A_07575 [Burkholderiaceae bacterium]